MVLRMELRFLGTGAGIPSKERNVSAMALELLQERGSIWLFDCGEATQHQILHTSIRPRKLEKIFITHLHGDHIYGLPGILSSRSFQDGITPLTVYGPEGIEEYVRTSLQISGTQLTYPLYFQTVAEGIVFEDKQFTIQCLELDHKVPSYGYRITEKDLPGQLLVDKLKDLGINPGPIYQQIKENEQTILPDGKIIERKDYIGQNKQGRVISIIGDTRYFKELASFVNGSDLLVHEATFQAADHRLAHTYFHSTTEQAANLAASANVKSLVLTHISSRYQGKALQQLIQEATTIFPNTTIANDFDSFQITNSEAN